MSDNPFPESPQKAYLRRLHLKYLAMHKQRTGRGLAYLGLPSAEMLDVKVWMPVLDHITAIEHDPNVALRMYRTATDLGIRDRTRIVERGLADTLRLLAMDDRDVNLHLTELYPSEREIFRTIRSISHDVVNLDLCGGFLYPRDTGESENADMLTSLVKLQARHRNPFILLLTFNMRDTGREEYDQFISDTFDQLARLDIDVESVREYYLNPEIDRQPKQLRRLRFCVPVYLQKIALNDFQVRGYKAWKYKTFYHCLLVFEPRGRKGALGLTWPPIDEFEELLRMPLFDVRADHENTLDQQETIIVEELLAPSINRTPKT